MAVQEMRREVEELAQCQRDVRELHFIMSRQRRKFWDVAKVRAAFRLPNRMNLICTEIAQVGAGNVLLDD